MCRSVPMLFSVEVFLMWVSPAGGLRCPELSNRRYEGHPINRENFRLNQEFVPVKHRKCNHLVAKRVGHAAAYPQLCWKVRSFVA